jgi:hypothetical protein
MVDFEKLFKTFYYFGLCLIVIAVAIWIFKTLGTIQSIRDWFWGLFS